MPSVRRRAILPALPAALAAFGACTAAAQQVEPYTCRNGLFPHDIRTIALGQVASAPSTQNSIYDDVAGCPGGARCARRERVPGGTEVLVSKRQAGWACVWWPRRPGHEVVGWMRDGDVAPAAAPPVPAPLAGRWASPYGGELTFAGDGPRGMRVTGEAVWAGGASVHTGELDGPVTLRQPRPNEYRASYADGHDSTDCAAEFLQLGAYLVASDNGNCGGANVRFDGVYVHAAPARRARRRS